MNERAGIWTIVVAAGTGSRFGSTVPKQFRAVAGRRVLDWSVAAASAVSEGLVVVLPRGRHAAVATTLSTHADSNATIMAVAGGETRSDSVRAGLQAVPESATTILVHDAARPAADIALFSRVVNAIKAGAEAAVPIADVVDTVRHVDGLAIDRDKLQIVQTPQGFDAAAIRNVHGSHAQATDDASLIEQAGGSVVTVAGDRWNIKLTTADDATVLHALLTERAGDQ